MHPQAAASAAGSIYQDRVGTMPAIAPCQEPHPVDDFGIDIAERERQHLDHAAEVGRVGVPVFAKVAENIVLDFSSLGISGVTMQAIARGIDVSRFSRGALVVRVEAVNIGSGAGISVQVFSAWPSAVAPATPYVLGTAIASESLTNASTAPAVLNVAWDAEARYGPAVDVIVRGSQPGGGTVACSATVSIGLLVWE